MFTRNVLPVRKPTWGHNPEDHHGRLQRLEHFSLRNDQFPSGSLFNKWS
jgi:hypothetical protein